MIHRLYKAKADHNGEWVVGYYLEVGGVPFILPEGKPLNSIVQVRRDTVCMGLGIKDRVGVDVFDGDKVKVEYYYIHEKKEMEVEVTWCRENCSFSPFNWAYDCDGCECYCEIETVEVIGNIYDEEDKHA